jgi:predicted transcriptional regulator
MESTDKLGLIAGVTASYLRRNSVGLDQISNVVAAVTQAFGDAERMLSGETAPTAEASTETARPEPAVSVRASVRPEYIVCLECGAKVKTLKRHLMSAHNLDPKAYRERWELKKDYPMTAPIYSEQRSAMAQKIGLGRKAGQKAPRRSSRSGEAAPRKGGRRKAAAKNGDSAPASE